MWKRCRASFHRLIWLSVYLLQWSTIFSPFVTQVMCFLSFFFRLCVFLLLSLKRSLYIYIRYKPFIRCGLRRFSPSFWLAFSFSKFLSQSTFFIKKKKKSNVSIFTFIDYALAVSSFLSIFFLRCLKLIMCKLIFLEGTFKMWITHTIFFP